MQRFAPIINIFTKTFHPFKVGSLTITPTYWQAITIVILIFLLLFTLARMRFLYVHWSLGKHAISMFFWGFLFALVIEGFFMVGGRTIFTSVLGMKKVPKPFSTILDIGRERLVKVMGVSDQKTGTEIILTSDDIFKEFNNLPSSEADKLYKQICKPNN